MFRRLRQLTLTLAAIVSLIVFPTALMFWLVLSETHAVLAVGTRTRAFGCVVYHGRMGLFEGEFEFLGLDGPYPTYRYLWSFTRDTDAQSPTASLLFSLTDPNEGMDRHAAGFGMQSGNKKASFGAYYPRSGLFVTQYGVMVPCWFIALLCLPAPLLWWRRRRRGLRAGVALCPVCNYDLRGTPGRCPECGWKQEGHVVATAKK